MNKISLSPYFFMLILSSAVFSGFVTNFVKLGEIGSGTILMDVSIIISIVFLLINSKYNINVKKTDYVFTQGISIVN